MPKNKTHKGTAKRVKVTGSGKLLARARQHAATSSSTSRPRRTRRLDGTDESPPSTPSASSSCSVARRCLGRRDRAVADPR